MRRLDAGTSAQLVAMANIANVAQAVQGVLWTFAEPPARHVLLTVHPTGLEVSVSSDGLTRDQLRVALKPESFLARLGSAASCVSVTARHHLDASAYCVRFGTSMEEGRWEGGAAPRAPGVSVCVTGLFSRMPVRQRAQQSPMQTELVRLVVTHYALAHAPVGVVLRDHVPRAVLAVGPAPSVSARMQQLFGGEAVEVATHAGDAYTVTLHVMRVRESSRRVQFVLVNGVPVADADWLLQPLVRALASQLHGPQQMGTPRTFPVLLMCLECAPGAVQLMAADAGIGCGVLFSHRDAVSDAIQQAAAQLGVDLRAANKHGARTVPERALASPSTPRSLMSSPAPRGLGSPLVRSGAAVRPARGGATNATPKTPEETVRSLLASWQSPCWKFGGSPTVGLGVSASPSQDEVRLDARHLSSARIVGQADRKIILAVLDQRFLVAFDQHAVSERVLLERLQARATPAHMVMEVRDDALDTLGPLMTDALRRWRAKLAPWWIVEEAPVLRVVARAQPCQGGHLTLDDLREYVHDLIASAGIQARPRAVERLLAYKACRSAIKFGDPLSSEAMLELLAQVAQCSFPFQCAHGRQSVVVLCTLR